MTRKKIKSALSASLKAEDQAVKDRFERAETILKENQSLSNQANSDTSTSSDEEAKSTPKKRVIRDSFTLPESDYELIKTLKSRYLSLAINVNKSEVIRAGLHALNQMSDPELVSVIESLIRVKTGRPGKKE